jgi:pyruvate kinase
LAYFYQSLQNVTQKGIFDAYGKFCPILWKNLNLMKIKERLVREMIDQIEEIILSANELENKWNEKIMLVTPGFRQSAVNLIHYMALREHDLSALQENLHDFGLTPFDRIEPHVMRSLLTTKVILQRLVGDIQPFNSRKTISVKKSRKMLNRNTIALFGKKSGKRQTRIMVTIPEEAADNPLVVSRFLKAGMNCARINCASYEARVWERMIRNIQTASTESKKECRIMMDLAGPKLRTGEMIPGPKVIHVKPERDDVGNVIKPVQLWFGPPGKLPPHGADAVIPVDAGWIKNLCNCDIITFTDSRQKKCTIEIADKEGDGRWAKTYDSAYIATGAEFYLKREDRLNEEVTIVGEFLPVEQSILLNTGDTLIIHKEQRTGEPAKFDKNGKLINPAHISCTMPEIFQDVRPGQPILFDDGRMEGIIEKVKGGEITVKIVNAKDVGSKLRAGKGINLPGTKLSFSGMTAKDRKDLRFIVNHADAVSLSFVNNPNDVMELMEELKISENKVGVILKIETRTGFENLPLILLEAMQVDTLGVMLARGDLAVEVGWDNMAMVQEEILRICEAAHVPDIWATQVLESMAKKGIPSRAEITDAALAQRADCVMLNKGSQINKAIKMLDKILKNMQELNKKRTSVLPKLPHAQQLILRE